MSAFKIRAGFTFVELFFIVVLIAVLAGISIPNFLRAQVQSKIIRAYSDMRVLSMGLESYAVDYGEYPVSEYTGIYDLEEIALIIEKAREERREEMGEGYEFMPRGLLFGPGMEDMHPASFLPVDIPLASGPYQELVRKAAESGVASLDFPGNYTGIDWYILKEPVDYLHGMGRPFRDVFGRWREWSPYLYYRNPFQHDREELYRNKYLIISQGPGMSFDYPDFNTEYEQFLYDPTNGTVSAGDLIITGP